MSNLREIKAQFTQFKKSYGNVFDFAHFIAANEERYNNYIDTIQKLSPEAHRKLQEQGFDFQSNPNKYFVLLVKGKPETLRMAVQNGHALASEAPIGQGQNKTVYLLESGNVLKVSDLNSFIYGVLNEEDDLTFQNEITQRFPNDVDKMVAKSTSAGVGIPATTQELILRTDITIKVLQKKGFPDLANKVLEAHYANPLAKYHVFEQKTRNSGLALRGDQFYVVAHDYSDGFDISHIQGDWKTIATDVPNIIPLPIELFNEIPEVQAFIDSVRQIKK